MRCWVKTHPVSQKHMKEGTPVYRILLKEPELEADFTPHPNAVPQSKAKGLVRSVLDYFSNYCVCSLIAMVQR